MRENSKNGFLHKIIIAITSGIAGLIIVTTVNLPKFDVDDLITRKSIGIKLFCAANKIDLSDTKDTKPYLNSTNETKKGLFIWIVKNERDNVVQDIQFDDKNTLRVINCFTCSRQDPFAKRIISCMEDASFPSKRGFQLNNMNFLGKTTTVLAVEKEADSEGELHAVMHQIEQRLRGNKFDYPIACGENRTPVASLHVLTDMELHKSHLFPILLTLFGTLICIGFISSLPKFSKNLSSDRAE